MLFNKKNPWRKKLHKIKQKSLKPEGFNFNRSRQREKERIEKEPEKKKKKRQKVREPKAVAGTASTVARDELDGECKMRSNE